MTETRSLPNGSGSPCRSATKRGPSAASGIADPTACPVPGGGARGVGAGATPADVAKLTTYVVGYRPEFRPVLGEARASVFGSAEPPASTLVGVQALADPGYLVEIEAIAVID